MLNLKVTQKDNSNKGEIGEWIVEKVGNKYVTAKGAKFEEHDGSYGGLKQKSNGCVDYIIIQVNKYY